MSTILKKNWRETIAAKPSEPVESDNLDRWLTMDLDTRRDIALAVMDGLMQIADSFVEENCYIAIGTTENKSNYVFTVRNGGYDNKKMNSYHRDFIVMMAEVAGKVDTIEVESDNGQAF